MKNSRPRFLPDSVSLKREERRKEILSTIIRGICLRMSIILAEFIGFFLWGSSSLLLDGLSGLLDIGIALLLMLCVYLADKPPDTHHPLGHGRFEPIAGFQLGFFLAIIGGYLVIKQILAATSGTSVSVISPFAWIIPFMGMIVLEAGYRRLRYIAKKQNSPALFADAVHYRVDGITSLFAVLALAAGAYFPRYSMLFDHIGAGAIAIFMIVVGVKAAWENLHSLLDRAPDSSYFVLVEQAARRVEGVRGTEKLRIQSYGPDAQVSIDIEVDPILTVEEAHAITKRVRLAIQTEWPAVRDVIVHVEPYRDRDTKR